MTNVRLWVNAQDGIAVVSDDPDLAAISDLAESGVPLAEAIRMIVPEQCEGWTDGDILAAFDTSLVLYGQSTGTIAPLSDYADPFGYGPDGRWDG